MTWKIHIYIYMGVSMVVHGCFQGVSRVFQVNFTIISRGFQCDSWVCNWSARGVFRAFPSIGVCMGSCHGCCTYSKPFFDKKNHPKTPLKHDAHTFESFWKHAKNDLEAHCKYLWKPPKTSMKYHPKDKYRIPMAQWLLIIRKTALLAQFRLLICVFKSIFY